MTEPLLDVLLAHDAWGTRRLLEVCQALSTEQYQQDHTIGLGSLERTATHLVSTLYFFADRLNRRAPRPRLEHDGQSHTPADLLAHLELAERELADAVARTLAQHGLTDVLNWTDTEAGVISPSDQVAYAVVFAQIVDHGIHHRAQAMAMLAMLGRPEGLDWHPFEWDEANRPG